MQIGWERKVRFFEHISTGASRIVAANCRIAQVRVRPSQTDHSDSLKGLMGPGENTNRMVQVHSGIVLLEGPLGSLTAVQHTNTFRSAFSLQG